MEAIKGYGSGGSCFGMCFLWIGAYTLPFPPKKWVGFPIGISFFLRGLFSRASFREGSVTCNSFSQHHVFCSCPTWFSPVFPAPGMGKNIDDVSSAAVLLAVSKAKRWQLALALTSLRSSRRPKFLEFLDLKSFILMVWNDLKVDPWFLMCLLFFTGIILDLPSCSIWGVTFGKWKDVVTLTQQLVMKWHTGCRPWALLTRWT